MRAAHPKPRSPASVSHELVQSVLSALAASGVADPRIVATLRARLTSGTVRSGDQTRRYSGRALLSLWEAIVGISHGDHSVGALLALHATDEVWGVVGEVLRQTPRLFDGYTQIAHYSRLVHQGVRITIERTPHDLIVRYQLAGAGPEPADGALAASLLWAMGNLALVPTRWFGVPIKPIMTKISCTPPKDMGPVKAVFGPAMTFCADQSVLIYRRSEIENVFRPAQPRILGYLDAFAERELDDLAPVDDINAVVALELRSSLPGGAPRIDVVAHALGLSTRTLQRRMTDAGSSFAVILDEVRKTRARELIQSRTRSLGEVAYLLGYSEQAALSRATRRWFGTSPSKVGRPTGLTS